MQWSDPIRADEFNTFVVNTKEVTSNSILKEAELKMWREKRARELQRKKISRKRLRSETGGLGLTKEDAVNALLAKMQKENEAEKKRVDAMRMWRMERDEMHIKGVAARKDERNRVKKMKNFMKSSLASSIPDELTQSIPDPEAEVWKLEEEKRLARAKKSSQIPQINILSDDEVERDIIVDEESSWLQNDFVSFDDDEGDEEDAGNARNARNREVGGSGKLKGLGR